MRKSIAGAAIVAALAFIPASAAMAQEDPADPNDVSAVDNPVDENDDGGFDDWGLLGLVGLAGLAGLAGRKRVTQDARYDRTTTSGAPRP